MLVNIYLTYGLVIVTNIYFALLNVFMYVQNSAKCKCKNINLTCF